MARCVYCGNETEKTDDHVVPSCLFLPKPENPVKVCTCATCNNNAKSQLDTYFRDRLMLDALAQQHPTVRKIRAGKFASAKEGGHSKLSRTYSATAIEQDVFVRAQYVGRYRLFQPVHSRIEEEIRYITKGLSFDRSGRRVPDNYKIDVVGVPGFHAADALEVLHTMAVWEPAYRLGKLDEFIALHARAEGGEHAEAWCFIFYKAVVFLANVMDEESRAWLTAHGGDVEPAPVLGLDRP